MKKICKIITIVSVVIAVLSILSVSSMAAQTPGITNGEVYKIKNASSGKYVNVHYGIDKNNTNVYQCTADGSVEQTFRVVYDSTNDAYRLYAMSSVNGTYRVLDIVKSNGSVVSGCNIQIYAHTDNTAQLFNIISTGNGYKITPKSNSGVAITANSGNGTSEGIASSATGNIYVSTYTGATNQQWAFELASDNHEDYYASSNWAYPVSNNWPVSSGYGYRYLDGDLNYHSGIDFAANAGTDIYSVCTGIVEDAGYEPDSNSGRGQFVAVVSSHDKLYGTNIYLRISYMHMIKDSSPLTVTDIVSKGTTFIGEVGETGFARGVHLHLGVISNGSTSGSRDATLNPFFFYPDIASDFTIN